MSRYLFYPGCAMESSARAYRQSIEAIAEPLGLELAEIDDWNCCGATEFVSLSRIPAYALIGRNLALAQEAAGSGTRTLVASCSACYLNLVKGDRLMAASPELRAEVGDALAAGGLRYDPGSLQIRHLLDVLVHDIGLEEIRSRVVRPLTGLRVAGYVGCMIARPDYDRRFSSHEQPRELDDLLAALGAEVIDFPLKTHCCGGHMTQIGPETALELIRRLVHAADQYKADLLATVCPMCQMNVDAYQGEMNRRFHTRYHMPIVFFTQLLALALGAPPDVAGFGMELTDARPALDKLPGASRARDTRATRSEVGAETAAGPAGAETATGVQPRDGAETATGVPPRDGAEAPARKKAARAKTEGLPMPRMDGEERDR